MNSIVELPPGATFSPADIVDRVLPMLDAVAHHRADDEHRYSASDIYWLIRDMLRRVNKDIDGEFYMKRLKKAPGRSSTAASPPTNSKPTPATNARWMKPRS